MDSERQGSAQYYIAVDATATGPELLHALQTLLTRTHTQTPRYAPARMVYPSVDLHPDRRLRSIYAGKAFDPGDRPRRQRSAGAAADKLSSGLLTPRRGRQVKLEKE